MGEEGEGEEYRREERRPERRGRRSRSFLRGASPGSGGSPTNRSSVDNGRADRVVTDSFAIMLGLGFLTRLSAESEH